MAEFNFSFPSQHPPGLVWEALSTPLSPELNHSVNSPRVNLAYENLDEEGKIGQATRIIYSPNFKAIGLVERSLMRIAPTPSEGTGIVDAMSDRDRTRVDVVEPGQVAEGHMEYIAEEAEDDSSLLIVRGEFVTHGIAEVIEKFWPKKLGNLNEWLIHYGIHNPAQRLLEHIPDIVNTK